VLGNPDPSLRSAAVYDRAAQAYDVLHVARGKDYAAEAERVVAEVRRRLPSACALLDAACGTGGHLRHLAPSFEAEGVDASPAMAARARERVPGVVVHEADLRTFDPGRTYDAVVCLFSSIGYLVPLEELRRGIANLARLLAPGGVLVVEPWFMPASWRDPGIVLAEAAEGEDLAVARVSRSWREGSVSHVEMQWLVASGDGIEHVVEHHEMGLYTVEEYRAAFTDAGCTVEHDPDGLIGRGLFTGVRQG